MRGGRVDEARTMLDEAVRTRRSCRLVSPAGAPVPATLCRFENAGVICNAPGHLLRVGEEVRLWVDASLRPLHFEASVLRVGVTVPDRGPDGLLLGFLQPLPEPPQADDVVLRAVLPGGAVLDLLEAPARLLRLSVSEVAVEVPAEFVVVFPEGSVLDLVLGSKAQPEPARVRVRGVVRGGSHLVYTLSMDEIADAGRHRSAVTTLRGALGL